MSALTGFERTLRRIAGGLGLAPELLRLEAFALQQRFVDAGVVADFEQIAVVACEMNTTPDELKREIDEVLAAC